MHPDTHNLSSIRALTFDCYGTLIDWESGLASVLNAWAQSAGVPQRDDQVLEWYARHEAALETRHPFVIYRDVVGESLRGMMVEAGVPQDQAWIDRLSRSIGDWPAFPDSAESLLRLKKDFQLCIISNVDRASFAGSARRLIAEFDLVVTAEDVGSYKPSQRNFHAMLSALAAQGIEQSNVLHVAQSLYHDIVPASHRGLRSVWINRRHSRPGNGATPAPGSGAIWEAEFPSMRDFAEWATRVRT